MNILKPQKLSKDDTIGIISPSFPLIEDFMIGYKDGLKELQNMGFKTKLGKTMQGNYGWQADKPKKVAEDINAMFADKEVKAIICQNSGHGAISVLEHIDYEIVKNNPKPFIGMSDITPYHFAFLVKTGMVGFHMDLLTYGLGSTWVEAKMDSRLEILAEVKKDFYSILTSDNKLQYKDNKWKTLRSGKAEGYLIGGALTSLCSLVGTPYFPSLDYFNDAILFWEFDDSYHHLIQKCLYQLKYSGVLERIKGMAIGTVVDYKPLPWDVLNSRSLEDVIMEPLAEYNFPILAYMEFGHQTPNLPMPIGIRAELDADGRSVRMLESSIF